MPKPKMLTCIARPKQQQGKNMESVSQRGEVESEKPPKSKQLGMKSLSSQIKGMAVKASGAYKCNPCSHPKNGAAGEAGEAEGVGAERFRWSGSYRRTTSSSSASRWGKEMEARLKVLSTVSSREGSVRSPYASGAASAAASGRRTHDPNPLVLLHDSEPREWVAQVEPGVLITFLSLPRAGNDLKRIRFSRDTFDNTQAQKWWTDNHEKVMELYNVQRLHKQGVPFPTDPPKPQQKISKNEFGEEIPGTAPQTPEILPWNLQNGGGIDDYSSSESYDESQQQQAQEEEEEEATESEHINESSSGTESTPNIRNTNKIKSSSMDDQSIMSRSSIEVGNVSLGNSSELETEWVEEDEPGVYITIKALSGGARELRRVRFSRERFGEMNARVWWEENRARIHEQYLIKD